jgi:PelA/Pel-15E family pectate lyase
MMMRVDRELKFEDKKLHEAVLFALDQLIKAQYPNGAWPQRYNHFADPAKFPVKKASYPDSWSRKWPGPDYHFLYTFNDNTVSDLIDMFLEAWRIYGDERYRRAAEKGGEFILLAQMPEPQPAWAQQYDVEMHPAWARVFEPPSVTGGESQGIIRTLFALYRETGEKKYLESARRALDYLKRSVLPPVENPSEARRRFRPGEPVLARFYELKTNRPLYITKGTRVTVADRGPTNIGGYQISYTDESVITHYGVLISGARLDEIETGYQRLLAADPASIRRPVKLRGLSPWDEATSRASDLGAIIAGMDERGAWVENGSIGKSDRIVSVFVGRDMVATIGDRVIPLKENETLQVFQGTGRPRERIIRSETFARNVDELCDFLEKSNR